MVAGHRRHIGGPHQLVLGLDGRDRCGVLPQQVRHRQRPHRHPVDRHRRRIHRRRQRRLKRRHRGPRLPGHRHGLRRHRTQPPRIRRRRGRHRRRRRTLPHPRRQARRHLPKRHRRRPQLLSQPIPRRGRRQQRARPRTRIHQHGVDFRWQNWKIQPPLPLPLTMRSHLIVSPRRGERGHFDKLICNIPIAYKRADICGALMPISACISCSAALTGWWSGTVASGEAGGLDVFG
ncbi:Uncharacterised protein [Mycobacterium tuberculosis]|nr:Uncharacterised protein [Mycobacterium tuberculosis]